MTAWLLNHPIAALAVLWIPVGLGAGVAIGGILKARRRELMLAGRHERRTPEPVRVVVLQPEVNR